MLPSLPFKQRDLFLFYFFHESSCSVAVKNKNKGLQPLLAFAACDRATEILMFTFQLAWPNCRAITQPMATLPVFIVVRWNPDQPDSCASYYITLWLAVKPFSQNYTIKHVFFSISLCRHLLIIIGAGNALELCLNMKLKHIRSHVTLDGKILTHLIRWKS